MLQKLSLHPSAHASAPSKLLVKASAEVIGRSLILSYKIEIPAGAPAVVWPRGDRDLSTLSERQRKDELWKTTCLEAFLLFEDGRYIELNFAPAGDWNAYSFESYRYGMKPEVRIDKVTDFQSAPYELSVKVDLARAVESPQHFRLGLTCVIETEGGERSYWSLKHAGEKPDFHDSRGHILEMRI